MNDAYTAFSTVDRTLREDPDLTEQKRDQLMNSFRKYYQPPLESDRWIYRIVVGSLGLSIILTITFSFFIYYKDSGNADPKIPDLFLAIGSAAVGALAGLLAPSPSDRR
ncbi:MAG: hypothetical protein RL693_1857 [Verrucomicrobiota bacterium]|jgi:hypothetical protein